MTHLVPKGYAYGRFAPNQGDIAGYVHRIWRKYRAKWVVQMAGMNFKTRSKLSMEIPDVLQYDRIMLGCPIWCGAVPNIVLTLLDAVDITEKHIALFTTSGASKPDHPAVKLKKSYPEARWHRPLNANNMTDKEIADWM